MAYQVIARKYRPQRFGDVVGQEHVTRTLSQAIGQERIAHAYLFCGPRGTGKTTIARIFAKCLNCTDGPKVDFDDSDPRCAEISEGRSLDVLEIDGASNNGVEQVRELRETCKYAPASSRFKIYIIDEVHMLTTAAFNALLKTLEEPPAHVKFMFATTDPEKVLPTILSRCQRFDLRRIPTALIAKHLEHIAGKEGVTVEPPALFAIARGAEGAMRDAESTLDQLISFCGMDIKEADVLSMFGLAAQSQLLDLARAVLAGEPEPTLRQFNDLATKGKDLGRLLTDLLNHVRNLLIYQLSRGDVSMLEVSEAETSALAQQSGLVSPDALTRVLEVLADTESRLRGAASRKIVLEVGLLKAIEARNSVSLDAVLKQLQALRDGGSTGSAAAPAAQVSSRPATAAPSPSPATRAALTPAEAPRQAQAAAPAAPYAAATVPAQAAGAPASTAVPAASAGEQSVEELWSALMASAGPLLRASLERGHPVSFNKKQFTVGFDRGQKDQIVIVESRQSFLQEKMRDLGYSGVQFKFVEADPPEGWQAQPAPEQFQETAPAPAPATPAQQVRGATARSAQLPPLPGKQPKQAPAPFNKEEFKNDPLIRRALEVFKGQIVEVRAS
jgi:DNA polymerase III subunit gamma/tau